MRWSHCHPRVPASLCSRATGFGNRSLSHTSSSTYKPSTEMPTMCNYMRICNPVRSPSKSSFLSVFQLRSYQGEFFLGDPTQTITWSTVSTGRSVYEAVQLQTQQLFSESSNEQAAWGQFYFATAVVRLASMNLDFCGGS